MHGHSPFNLKGSEHIWAAVFAVLMQSLVHAFVCVLHEPKTSAEVPLGGKIFVKKKH
jgi:hypothetical protein